MSVSTFGKKKTATAVAYCKEGKGLIKVNGTPIDLFGSPILRSKVCVCPSHALVGTTDTAAAL